MERGPSQGPDKSPERSRPTFERASNPELVRQGEIDLKAARISGIVSAQEQLYETFARTRHEGTVYSKEDLQKLEQPLLSPPGFEPPVRVEGQPKSVTDITRLARLDAKKRVRSRQELIVRAAKDMKDNGQSVSNGRITQTRRGLDQKSQTLGRPLRLSELGHACRKGTGNG